MRVDSKHRNVGFLALSGRCTVTSLTTVPSQHRTFHPLHHASYVTSQMAEVAVPRELFGKSTASSMGYGRPLCRHDAGPSSSIQVARQDRCVLRRSKCALTVRNGHWPGF